MAFINPFSPIFSAPSRRPSHCYRPHLPMIGPRQSRQAILTMSTASNTGTPLPTLETVWPAFAEKMRKTGEVPPAETWHELLDVCIAARESASKAIWLLNLMRETGVKPTALTYEKMLTVCAGDSNEQESRVAAFHLVEHMFNDKVLIGDVELPDGMEEVLRKILPPEAFE